MRAWLAIIAVVFLSATSRSSEIRFLEQTTMQPDLLQHHAFDLAYDRDHSSLHVSIICSASLPCRGTSTLANGAAENWNAFTDEVSSGLGPSKYQSRFLKSDAVLQTHRSPQRDAVSPAHR